MARDRLPLPAWWRRLGSRPAEAADTEPFDEAAYLERYPDVARALATGAIASGRAHFLANGRAEGRIGAPLVAPARVELDPASRILTIESPAFATTPPMVVDRERIPDDLRAMYASLWHDRCPAREIVGHLLHDVIVVGDGLVFDMAGQLVSASAHQTPGREIERATAVVRTYLDDGASAAIAGTTLLCEKVGLSNYGHWLFEMAPIASLLRDRLAADWFVRLPLVERSGGMSAVIRDSIDLLGIDPARVRWGVGSMPLRYESLVLTHGFSHHGAAYSPLASTALEAMAAQVPAEAPRKIWVSRAGERRRLRSEAALCEALAARGWLVVAPGTMSLRRQIAVFKQAEIVAGVAGAGLTNVGFAPPSARIVAFVPCRMPVIFFYMLAQMKGQAYAEIRCAQEHDHGGAFNWEGLLLMDEAEALAKLDEVLAM